MHIDATMHFPTENEIRGELVKSSPHWFMAVEQYFALQQFILDTLGTRYTRLEHDLRRAICVQRGAPEPPRNYTGRDFWHEGMPVPRGKARQFLVVPDGTFMRAQFGADCTVYGVVEGSQHRVFLPDGQHPLHNYLGGSASAIARLLGHGRRDGMRTWEVEYAPGRWARLEDLRPPRWPSRYTWV